MTWDLVHVDVGYCAGWPARLFILHLSLWLFLAVFFLFRIPGVRNRAAPLFRRIPIASLFLATAFSLIYVALREAWMGAWIIVTRFRYPTASASVGILDFPPYWIPALFSVLGISASIWLPIRPDSNSRNGKRQRAALLGLLFPGIGQFFRGAPWRGLIFGVTVLLSYETSIWLGLLAHSVSTLDALLLWRARITESNGM